MFLLLLTEFQDVCIIISKFNKDIINAFENTGMGALKTLDLIPHSYFASEIDEDAKNISFDIQKLFNLGI